MNCLIIEDSRTLSHILAATLRAYGYPAVLLSSLEAKKKDVFFGDFQLAIVGTSLQNVDSCMLLKEMKKSAPTLFLIGINSTGNWEKRINFLKAGADDVLSYPFPMQELMVRIQAVIRRPRNSEGITYKLEDIELDPNSKLVKKRSLPVKLRKKEYILLEYLVRNRNRPISRTELIDNVWDYKRINSSNTVDVTMSNLRKQLNYPEYLETIHGFGYQLNDRQSREYEKKEATHEEISNEPPTEIV